MKHFTTHRPGHSVETAFQVVYSSVSQQLDPGRPVFLVLIDLSAAFDTDSHESLISLLASKFGIGGIVLQWFQSYLSNPAKVDPWHCVRAKLCQIAIS